MHQNKVATTPLTPERILRNVGISIVCGIILLYTEVVPRMITSSKTYKIFLYPSFVLAAAFLGMWVYTACYLQKKDARWFQTHERFLYVATGTAVAGSIFWIIGMWPELGFLTVPLYMVATTMLANLAGLAPSGHAKGF